MSCNLTCNSGLPCNVQGDNDRVRFAVALTQQRLDWVPSFKLAHYKYFRIRWASFKCPLPNEFVLFIYINSLGEGKQDWRLSATASSHYPTPTGWTTTAANIASPYTVCMPIEHNTKVSFDYTSDVYGWIPLPKGVNLNKFVIYGYPELETPGTAPPGFITSTNPVLMELEFSCSI